MILRFVYCCVLVSGVSLAGCTENQENATSAQSIAPELTGLFVGDLPEIEKRGTIRVGDVASDFVGPEFVEQERYNADSFHLFCERRALKIQRTEFPDWGSALTALSEGRVDVLLGSKREGQPSIEGWEDVKQTPMEGWLIRKPNQLLFDVATVFLRERAMTGHTRDVLLGDLDAIRKRKVVRVITLNRPYSYFIYRGEQYGFDYELAKMVAGELGVRLELVVPSSHSEMISWLLEGKGDFIAGALTITPPRRENIAFSLPYLYVDEVLVTQKKAKSFEALQDLEGLEVVVRENSSYAHTLKGLKEDVALNVKWAEPNQETSALIEAVAKGEIQATVADSHLVAVEERFRAEPLQQFVLTTVDSNAVDFRGKPRTGAKEIAFGLRKGDVQLKAFLDGFVRKTYRSLAYNMARKRYFENSRTIARASLKSASVTKQISPYDKWLKEYSRQYGFDWRLMAAQAFQESRFNPKAVSWVGAVGVFQIMPNTAKELGIDGMEEEPKNSIKAGIKYMAWLVRQFDAEIEFRQRIRFALAAFNAGLGHVKDARRLAKSLGLDPNRWFENVEVALLKLQDRRYYKRAKHGYCRGSEPVRYVSEIQSRYDAYVKIIP